MILIFTYIIVAINITTCDSYDILKDYREVQIRILAEVIYFSQHIFYCYSICGGEILKIFINISTIKLIIN